MSTANQIEEPTESYREHIATVDEKGKRLWIYAKAPGGKFFRWRALVAAICFTLLFGAPFVKINGHPLILFNVFDREFVLVGKPFFPSDFYLFAIGLIIFFVFIILFTVIYGRIWCGWTCPQTLFMEMVFRQIEYAIEGSAQAQKRLNALPWNREKIAKRGGKYFAFFLVSTLIAHTVMAYLIGPERVWKLITTSPTENPVSFIALTAFTGVFYFVFAYFREQVCTTICPYGRLQGVLMNNDSAQVMYDYKRGEPRGKKGTTEGDCVDCHLCVQVCPTGIDIRNGTQLECVNCTACMDACDEVMLIINRKPELIRIDSISGINDGKKFRFTRRVGAYTAVLAILICLEAFLFYYRSDLDITVLRVPGLLYQKQADGRISNLYNIQFVNKTFDTRKLVITSPLKGVEVRLMGGQLQAGSAEKAEAVAFIVLPKDMPSGSKLNIPLEITDGKKLVAHTSTTFFSPGQ